jgi:hypothetical protein
MLGQKVIDQRRLAVVGFTLGGQSKPAGQGQLKIDQWSVGSFKTDQ